MAECLSAHYFLTGLLYKQSHQLCEKTLSVHACMHVCIQNEHLCRVLKKFLMEAETVPKMIEIYSILTAPIDFMLPQTL
jgi:hypothetical protein